MSKSRRSQGKRRRVAALVVLTGAGALLLLGAEQSAAADFTVEPADRKVELQMKDGRPTGSMQVAAPGDSNLTVDFARGGRADGCVPDESPTAVPAHSRKDVTLTFTGCGLANGATTSLLVTDGAASSSKAVELTLTLEKTEPAITRLEKILAVAIFISGVVVWWTYRGRKKGYVLVEPAPTIEEIKAGAKRYIERVPVPRDPMPETKEGWSFKDSYLGNVTLVTTAVAALGSTETLGALWGDIDASEKSTLLVGLAVAAFLIALAPFLIRTIGKSGEVTVGGLFVGVFATMTGAGVLVGTIVTSLSVGGVGAPVLWWLIGLGLAELIRRYSVNSVKVRMQQAFPTKDPELEPPTPSETAAAADKISQAVLALAQTIAAQYPVVDERDTSAGDDPLSRVPDLEQLQAELERLQYLERPRGVEPMSALI